MVGRYEKGKYLRGDILRKGLAQNRADVDVFLGKGRLKYLRIARRVLKNDYDHLFATGTLTFFFSRMFCRKPVVFDAFISNYDSLVHDRKLVRDGSLKAKMLRFGDKYSCRLANKSIFDTEEHKKYFIEEFGLESKAKDFFVVEVGADNDVFYPAPETGEKKTLPFTVLFYGTFIPLHGVEYIIRAAKMLEKEDIKFLVYGTGQTFEADKKLAESLEIKNMTFGNVSIDKGPQGVIGPADICLGIFGDTNKAKRVIPTKGFQIIAMKKPLLTGDSPASRDVFTDRMNALLCSMADSKALADAIMLLKKDAVLRQKIAEGGYVLYKEKYTSKALGKKFLEAITP